MDPLAVPPLLHFKFKNNIMKHKYFIFSILVMQSIFLLAQVGINNLDPTATLDVIGDVKVQEKLYLENPGSYIPSPSSKLLMVNDATGSVIKFDVSNSVFGPLNYVQFVIKNVSERGLDGGFNTKISADKYTIAVHGYFFDSGGDTNVYIRSRTNGNYVEGQQFFAYVSGGTWWLKAFVNNSEFIRNSSTTWVDFYMDLIIYRNNFITKIWDTPLTINMNKQETATAPLPSGF